MTTEDYTLRISQATPLQLVTISHQLLLDFLDTALKALDEGDEESFFKGINKAKSALTQLLDGLDLTQSMAQDLCNLYFYASERLNKALFAKDRDAALEVQEMFTELLEAWVAIEDTPDERLLALETENQQDQAGAPQQVFAGLTYGQDGLSEYIPEDENRGFKA